MTRVLGPPSASVERYLNAACCVPSQHLRYLRDRGCLILMAPTIALGLDSNLAAERRGCRLSRAQFEAIKRDYDPEKSRVVGLYEPDLRLVVLPTGYSTDDPEFQVVHELGHALTMERISNLDAGALLAGLPGEIQRHIGQPGYEEREHKVAEVVAEGYAWMVVGREDQLPTGLVSAVFAMLPDDEELGESSV
jgi:hypothetical protein